jgi:hypothetical protein
MRAYRESNRDHCRRVKHAWDIAQFGLTVQEYGEILNRQGNVCAICHKPGTGGNGIIRKLVVDHCHKSGFVRGLLCGACNRGLGFFRDNATALESAASYIRKGETPAKES